jgi:GrpB-like predicted nucleotidyltransferase (UPF0157 family)
MKREPIEIREHSPQWREEFLQIGGALRGALGELALRIDHIGSTSVPGLAAKPIIDVQISIRSLHSIGSLLWPMERIGYAWRQDNPEKTKRYFRELPGARRTHIHVRAAGSWNEQFALLFRDFLRVHVEDQRRYVAVKRELAEKYRDERERYTDAKEPIIWEIMQRANRWAAAQGWEPGPSDA